MSKISFVKFLEVQWLGLLALCCCCPDSIPGQRLDPASPMVWPE